jgi:hypothetical protein
VTVVADTERAVACDGTADVLSTNTTRQWLDNVRDQKLPDAKRRRDAVILGLLAELPLS